MPQYLVGALIAFAEPFFHAWANIIDNYFSNKVLQRLTAFLFISEIIGLAVLPVIFFLDPPTLLPWKLLGILFVISVIEIAYLYPYYWSLRHTDTSVVASLFALGRISVPILAFFFVGERLTSLQYIGFLIIILASVLLTLDIRKLRLNRAFFLMLIVSIILGLQAVLYKYFFEEGGGWGSSVVWGTLMQFFIMTGLILIPANFHDLKSSARSLGKVWKLFGLMEILGWLGNLGSSYAVYLIPVSVAKGIASTQPIFVLIFAVLFSRYYPRMFREYIGRDGVAKKGLLFVLTILGVLLTIIEY